MSIPKPLIMLGNGEQGEISSGLASFSTQVFREHFFGNLTNNWGTFNVGAGSLNTVNVTGQQTRFGIIRHATGTTATGTAGIHTGQAMTQIGGIKTHIFGGVFSLQAASSATQRFIIRAGLSNNVTVGADPTDGIYIRYTDNINSGRLQLVCRRASVEAVFNSVFTPTLNENVNWYVVVNGALTSADLYISTAQNNPTLAGSVTTAANFPLNSTVLGFMQHIQKTVGITTSLFDVDLSFYDLA